MENGWVYIEIKKGMYGLPQAGILANKLRTARLAEHGYYPRPATFALVVDDFGGKIKEEEHGEHLINALKEHYEVTVDMEGKIFCGIHLNWDYEKCNVYLAMPGYIAKDQTKYGHTLPKHPQHLPCKHVPIKYSTKTEWVKEDLTEPLKQMEIKCIQYIVGTLLYYSRAVDPILAAALSTIALQQAMVTKQTEETCHQLLDYVSTHPNAV
eukprot:8452442-Ditylum_brightwellii.AAC.1